MVTLIDKLCPICDREFKVNIGRINAGQGKFCSIQCAGKAKYTGGRLATGKRQREKNRSRYRAYNLDYNRKYRDTIRGHLILTYHHLTQRCNNPRYHAYCRYGGRGIKNVFKNSAAFADYVMHELHIDPRGLEIHRINNDSDYQKGNIEFLTTKNHGIKHRKIGVA